MKVSPVLLNNSNYVGKIGKTAQTAKSVANPIKQSGEFMSKTAATAIAAAAMVQPSNKDITVADIEKNLINIGYEKDQDGNFNRTTFSKDSLKLYEEVYGEGYDICLKNVTRLTKDNVKEFKEFLNIDPVEGKKMFNNNFENLTNIFCNLKFNAKLTTVKDENIFRMVANIINNPLDIKTQRAFNNYKGKVYEEGLAKEAQKYLRSDKSVEPDKDVKSFIKNISSYIETQKIPQGTKLYRGERFYILNNAELKNGEKVDLAQMMQKAAESPSYKDIQDVQEFIKNNEITVTQPAFMPTSTNREGEFERKGWIFWELETEPNTKGIYTEAISTSFFTFQDEVLLQKGSKIKIEDANYDGSQNIWYLKGKVSN